jgi:hypothetical protein
MSDKLDKLEKSIDGLTKLLLTANSEKQGLSGWIHQAEFMALARVSRSQLHKMRKAGMLSESSVTGKTPWYRVQDLIKILKENEKLR